MLVGRSNPMTHTVLKTALASSVALSIALVATQGKNLIPTAFAQNGSFPAFSWSETNDQERADYELAQVDVQIKKDALLSLIHI